MKDLILDFIQRKNIQIPKINEECNEELTCYIHLSIPEWDFFIFAISETGDFANALVYSPFTYNIPDIGLIPLKNFIKSYTDQFPEFDFFSVKIDEAFTPKTLNEIMRLKN